MQTMRDFLIGLDPYLIWPFRLMGPSFAGFLLGTFILCLFCAAVGDICSILVRRMNRKVYGEYHDEMIRKHNLSVRAIGSGDKTAYKAANKLAHEAFGKYFFSQIGAFTVSLWPAPFTLAWMDLRFGHVDFSLPFAVPGLDRSVGYVFFFVPLYIAARMLYGRCMRLLPAYRRLAAKAVHGSEKDVLRFENLGRGRDEGRGDGTGKADHGEKGEPGS